MLESVGLGDAIGVDEPDEVGRSRAESEVSRGAGATTFTVTMRTGYSETRLAVRSFEPSSTKMISVSREFGRF